jgi:hypothetical protein
MKSSAPAPVFILGSGRSGTTLLASLINRFPGVHIAKETGYVSRSFALLDGINSAGGLPAIVGKANSWLEVEGWAERASVHGYEQFAAASGLVGAAAFIRYVWQLDSARPWGSLSHVGDNTPAYVWAIPKIDALLPHVKYIHMVRDPRDVAASMLKMRFGANDAVTAALDWSGNLGAWLASERLVPEHRRLEMRYEDLCADPGRALVRVAGFLGIPEAQVKPALDQHAQDASTTAGEFASVAGKAHHKALPGPVSQTQVGRHTRDLTAEQVRSIEEVAQLGMLAYGYEPGAWHLSPIMEDRRLHFVKAYLRDAARAALRKPV